MLHTVSWYEHTPWSKVPESERMSESGEPLHLESCELPQGYHLLRIVDEQGEKVVDRTSAYLNAHSEPQKFAPMPAIPFVDGRAIYRVFDFTRPRAEIASEGLPLTGYPDRPFCYADFNFPSLSLRAQYPAKIEGMEVLFSAEIITYDEAHRSRTELCLRKGIEQLTCNFRADGLLYRVEPLQNNTWAIDGAPSETGESLFDVFKVPSEHRSERVFLYGLPKEVKRGIFAAVLEGMNLPKDCMTFPPGRMAAELYRVMGRQGVTASEVLLAAAE